MNLNATTKASAEAGSTEADQNAVQVNGLAPH
jgi:hypothetical protein